jgi:signal transduction histidine kinase
MIPKTFRFTCRSNEVEKFHHLYCDAKLLHRAAHDAAMRSRISALLYLVIFAIVVAFTPFYAEHPAFILRIGVLLIIGTLLRALCVWQFDKLYITNPNRWIILNFIGTSIQAAGWGVLCIMSIHYYAWQWPTMITCLSAAAFSAGIVTIASPLYYLTVSYLLLIFSPTLIYTVIHSTQQSLIAAFLFGTYSIFLFHATKRLNKEYWDAQINARLLDERAKELEAKIQELESFSYSVSHDLRSPLRAIDGYSQILLDDAMTKLDSNECGHLQRIRSAAQRMGSLIDDLLQLSKVSKAKLAPQKLNLSNIVREHLENISKLDQNHVVKLEIEPDVYTVGDKALLDIAIQNLADNSWKYSRNRHNVKIRFGKRNENGETIYFIKDDGVGFDPQYLDKLFKPFHRLHNDAEFPGTGIGLATVQRIIERHHGRIWANAKIDKGATFYFTLAG